MIGVGLKFHERWYQFLDQPKRQLGSPVICRLRSPMRPLTDAQTITDENR
jgi:hypothetical protein